MTELIYLTDSYQTECTSRIVSIIQHGGIYEIVLTRTVFYPQGGGQPSDKGTLTGTHGSAVVKHVRMSKDEVIHECTITGTFEVDEEIHAEIDWETRYFNMRVHSAGHIVHEAVMLVAPQLLPLKGEHGKDAYIEYTGSLPIDKVPEIERHANTIVQNGLAMTTEFVSLEELEKRSSFVPPHLPKHKPLRILTISGFHAIPDGGTQLKNTKESGEIQITTIENREETVRIHYAVKREAAQDLHTSGNTGVLISAPSFIGLLLDIKQEILNGIERSDSSPDELMLEYLGNKSSFADLIRKITQVPKHDRTQVGTVMNQIKREIEQAIKSKQFTTDDQRLTLDIDITLPGHIPTTGHYHPTTLVIREMNAIFAAMGFSVGDGPEIETDEYNYNRVNLPMDHPARDLQDSIYIEEPTWLLRTHTSSVESHLLQDIKPPFRYVIPGKVYRYENANATNNIMFYQYEGLAVGTDITMADLKGTLDVFVRKFFGADRETRFRCKYYPQVEPGVGVDISCSFCNKKGCTVCKGRGWIEMLGAGMVHPNMFRKAGLDPAIYSGFAFGMGLDRIVMQRYGIQDIRSLYNGDIGYKE